MKDFNPSSFYISVIDLFAILLPGALVSLMIYKITENHFCIPELTEDRFCFSELFMINGQTEPNVFLMGFTLLFASYLFGHIISQISAYLDEWVYDNFKDIIYRNHRRVKRVIHIRENNYGNVLTPVYVNTYQWSTYKLQKDYPEAASEIERYMADSKFFRSLFVVLSAGLFVLAFPKQPIIGWVAIGFVLIFIFISALFDFLLGELKKSIDEEGDAQKRADKEDKKKNLLKKRQWFSFLTLLTPFVLLSIQVMRSHSNLGLACALLAAFALVRYFKKRRKATETAYQYIIFLEELNTPNSGTKTNANFSDKSA